MEKWSEIKLQINIFLNDMADKLAFMTDYDFLNLGWGPLDLTALYGGAVFLLLLLIIILLLVRRRKKKKATKAELAAEATENTIKYSDEVFEKWQADMPESKELLEYWEVMSDDDKHTVGNLSREKGWCFAYMKQMGFKESSYQAVLTLWQYQGIQTDDLLKQMLRELADLRIQQSMAAVSLIKEINDERIVPLLLLALLKKDKYPPARVADALSAFGAVSGRALTALYRKVESDEYKVLIMDALGQLHEDCPMSVIKDAMYNPNEAMRRKAAEVVGIAAPENALEILRPLLGDSEGKVRAAAAAALGNIGGEESYTVLKHLMEADPDWQVKSTCQGFISSWEAAVMDKVAFDEVDEWMAEQQADAVEEKQA